MAKTREQIRVEVDMLRIKHGKVPLCKIKTYEQLLKESEERELCSGKNGIIIRR